MQDFYLKNKYIIRFLFIGGLLYLSWIALYYLVIKKYTNWDYNLNQNIIYFSHQFFNLLGVETHTEIESDQIALFKGANYTGGVYVGDNCNGFKLFSIFTFFIIAFPGNLKSKFWYIPFGIIMIHFANIIRVMALLLIQSWNRAYLDFNHNYTFTIFVYAVIFGLWWWWIKKYGKKNEA